MGGGGQQLRRGGGGGGPAPGPRGGTAGNNTVCEHGNLCVASSFTSKSLDKQKIHKKFCTISGLQMEFVIYNDLERD